MPLEITKLKQIAEKTKCEKMFCKFAFVWSFKEKCTQHNWIAEKNEHYNEKKKLDKMQFKYEDDYTNHRMYANLQISFIVLWFLANKIITY